VQRLVELGYSAGEECHYCGERLRGHLVFQGGRVGQICQPCLEARAQRLLKLQTLSRQSIAQAVKSVSLGTAAVAVAWLLFWRGFDALLGWMGSLALPMKIWILGALFLGAGFGVIAVRCGRSVIIENRRIIGALAAGSVLLGIFAGELCSAAWLIFRHFHVFSFRTAFVALPQMLKFTDGLYVGIKALTLCVAVAVPFYIVPRRKPTLGL
jgi:hypothetical protein